MRNKDTKKDLKTGDHPEGHPHWKVARITERKYAQVTGEEPLV